MIVLKIKMTQLANLPAVVCRPFVCRHSLLVTFFISVSHRLELSSRLFLLRPNSNSNHRETTQKCSRPDKARSKRMVSKCMCQKAEKKQRKTKWLILGFARQPIPERWNSEPFMDSITSRSPIERSSLRA